MRAPGRCVSPNLTRMLVAALAATVGAAAIGTAVASADTTPAPAPAPPIGAPSTLYTKNVRMDASLQDTTALVFGASLDQVAAALPPGPLRSPGPFGRNG